MGAGQGEGGRVVGEGRKSGWMRVGGEDTGEDRRAKRGDQFVLEVGHAYVKAERLHRGPAQTGTEAGLLQPAPEVTFLGLVAESPYGHGEPSRAEQPQEPTDAHRASDR